jgi:hypothetical protein
MIVSAPFLMARNAKAPTGQVRAKWASDHFSGFFYVARKPVGSNHHEAQ